MAIGHITYANYNNIIDPELTVKQNDKLTRKNRIIWIIAIIFIVFLLLGAVIFMSVCLGCIRYVNKQLIFG